MSLSGEPLGAGPVVLAERRRGPFCLTVVEPSDALLTVFELSGELDLGSIGILHTAVARRRPGAALVLDLRGLDFIDSTGLRVVFDTYLASRRADPAWRFAVVPGPPPVRRVFDVAGLTALLPWVESPEDVL